MPSLSHSPQLYLLYSGPLPDASVYSASAAVWLSGKDALPTPIPCDGTLPSALIQDRSALNLSNSILSTSLLRVDYLILYFLSSPWTDSFPKEGPVQPRPSKPVSEVKEPRVSLGAYKGSCLHAPATSTRRTFTTSKVKVCFKGTKGVEQGILSHLENLIFTDVRLHPFILLILKYPV